MQRRRNTAKCHDPGHRQLFFRLAYANLQEALTQALYEEARTAFKRQAVKIESWFNPAASRSPSIFSSIR
jgi:hypothetical protein